MIRDFSSSIVFLWVLVAFAVTPVLAQNVSTPPPPPGNVDLKDPQVQEEVKKVKQEDPAIAAEIQRLIQMGDISQATAVFKKYQEDKAVKGTPSGLSKDQKQKELGKKNIKEKEGLETEKEGETPEAEETEKKKEKKEEPSDLERILSGEIPQEVSTRIQQFGYDTFMATVSTFAPVDNVPVGPDYRVGPGDEFTLTLWGMVEGIYKLEVSRDGTVTLPKVGVTPVAGVRFGDLENHIRQKLSRYYRDFNLSVAMGNLRTIQVYVVGEVSHPGSYSLGSLSTAFNALFAAGGPTKRGSLRNIRVIRSGKVIKVIDLYQFLLKGDKTQDVKLQHEDTLLVTLIGPVVGIAGNVYRPAIYELNGPASLKDALDLAGGMLPTGYTSQVQVERIVAHEKKIVADLNLQGGTGKPLPDTKEAWAMPVQNMDMIKVLPISGLTENLVYLVGHVKRPGGYELHPGMKLRDLFPRGYEDLLPEPYSGYAEITRLVEPDLHPETIAFRLGAVISGEESQNIPLQRFDRVMIFSIENMREKPTVEITGAVQNPGIFPYLEGMKIKDLVFRSGNLMRSAYREDAEIVRTVQSPSGARVERLHVNLDEALKDNPDQNLPLRVDDHVYIRETPNWSRETVTFLGEVRFPGLYVISKGERLSSVIRRAGGFTEEAYPKGAVFTRLSVKELQEKRFQEYVGRTESALLRQSTTEVTGALSPEEISIQQQALQSNREVLNILKEGLKAFQGRIVIQLDDPDRLEGTLYDIPLMEGDSLFIPKRSQSVNVLGEVYNQGAVIYQPGRTVGDYLAQVGGPTRQADPKSMYILKADGSVMSQAQMGYFKSLADLSVGPGDSIMVPQKIQRPSFWRDTKDIVQILFQIAVTAATLKVLF